MKKLYVWERTEPGWTDAIVFDDLMEAERYADTMWDYLTRSEQKKQDAFCIWEMPVEDNETAQMYNDDLTGEVYDWCECVTGMVHDYTTSEEAE